MTTFRRVASAAVLLVACSQQQTAPPPPAAPVITTFTATPQDIPAGGASALAWAVTGSTSVSIDNGLGTVAASGGATVTPAQTTTYTLTATNGAGTITAAVTVGVKPAISSFTASPLTVAAGQHSTLSWSVAGATSLSIDNGVGTVTGNSTTVSPTATTTYTLTATNSAGAATASVTVTVAAPGAPLIQSFTASALVISAGTSSTLAWAVTGATSVGIDHGVGTVAATGSAAVAPVVTTTYTLTAANASGTTTATVTIGVKPVVSSFTATPQGISAGAASTLSWAVTGASSVSIDNSIGAVPATGSTSVTPAVTTTYTLAAVNGAGTTTASTTVTVAGSSTYITPSAVSGDVVVSMDTHVTTPISPYIYGLNFAEFGGPGLPSNWSDNWGAFLPRYSLNRFGGNRTTGHSFETGYSNCGSDCGPVGPQGFTNDAWGTIGFAQTPGLGNSLWPRIDKTFTNNSAFLLTVPIIGYVAKDGSGPQPIPAAPDANTPGTPDPAHWLQALPGAGHTATATPDLTDGFVYTNDLVKWVDTRYPAAKTDPVKNIQYELDNEPDIWGSTHEEIRGSFAGAATEMPTGFDELIDKSLAHARAIKSVVPSAVVWGGAFAGFDALTMLHYPDHQAPPTGYTYYFDYYLKRLHDADVAAGSRSVDVIDQHWYPQTDIQLENDGDTQTADVVNTREQITRSLWDPKYAENSWVAQFGMPSADAANCTVINAGVPTGAACAEYDPNCFCPIHLLTRIQSRIDQFYPGTKVAIGEWWYGRGGDISGGIVVADFLGVLGRYGAWGATMWPNACCGATYTAPAPYPDAQYTCAFKAFDVYRNYDGAGAAFGNREIAAALTDATFTNPAVQNERLTAYASLDAGNPNRVVIVAINKTLSGALNTGLQITHTVRFATAEVWQMTGTNGGASGTTGTTAAGTCTGPTRKADVALSLTNALNLTLPAQSITVVVLKP